MFKSQLTKHQKEIIPFCFFFPPLSFSFSDDICSPLHPSFFFSCLLSFASSSSRLSPSLFSIRRLESLTNPSDTHALTLICLWSGEG